ncbi:MAG: beta-propeller domain-containing protein [Planctomycetales bacterium]|nr:beta-propeller domain-containing protein [Planctomycetales bacterium]
MFRKCSPRFAWRQPTPAAPPHRGRARLHAERLEPRLLMAGDTSTPSIDISNALIVDVLNLPGYSAPTGTPQSNVELPDHLPSERALRAWVRQLADEQYGGLFGTTYQRNSYLYLRSEYLWTGIDVDQPINFFATTNDFGGSGLVNALTEDATNVQVQGVDEADLVEADGERLFVLREDELLIFRANGVDELALLSRVQFDSPASRMFLHGDRLAIVSEHNAYSAAQYGFGKTTTVTILDVADEAAPALVQKTEVDGRLIDLRAIDGKIVLITAPQSGGFKLPPLVSRLVGDAGSTPAGSAHVAPTLLELSDTANLTVSFDWAPQQQLRTFQYESRQEYLARVEDQVIDRLTIGFRSYDLAGNILQRSSLIDSARDMRDWLQGNSGERLVVSAFDMHADSAGPTDTQLLRAGADPQVYATQESIYVFTRQGGSYYSQTTEIIKLSFDAAVGKLRVAARGQVAGRLLNQFAADEHDGVLRVVMTDIGGRSGSGQGVYTLAEQGGRLRVLG